MKLQTSVLTPGGNDEQTLTVEVESNVATFYLGEKEIFSMDYEGNLDDFAIGILKLWGNITEVQDKNKEEKQP